ncbi:hypothetical protein BBO99_00000653 [Phytophthora kernoviae]|uniref:phosphomevalonate kinase n=2 Tax=Phytophthora kernoviae TaxID=325452 RepID=A0A3R7K3U9_9STRA|nr:hypothetical protein G195_001660 [Phytophthora kernoviae 00238/432]KAG2530718.1 hypothetical protein JM16_001485 [Phytophthora kernoviae]KAG2532912.1 hypothetical protein JM18_000873 [Phytophthora kernoviae]RLN43772.1 hypothetical protein BBI17_001470 [Phytophthora kernoviae]RLN85329.1 hypothetical protein BBO99_00000653 [Phytophthora kernoviae]
MTVRPNLCVSAPGKVLLVGGYLVLDEQYSGLVLSSTARFYSQVAAKPWGDKELESVGLESCRLFPLTVESQQFSQSIDGWVEESWDGRFRFQLREESDRNSYIEETVLCAINGIAGLKAFETNNTFQQLADEKIGVHVALRGDNDFYSQAQRLQAANQPLRRANVEALELFLPPMMEERGKGKLVALKTGMGSSAALVTSLVAALTAFFLPTISLDKRQEDLELVHNLAQLSHCYVQRKIGSGFDVSAACFGSQSYTRFPASILNVFTSEDALTSRDIGSCITNRALWNTSSRVNPFRLPATFHMMMGDVSSGSATVSMVRQVLTWKKENPDHTLRVMTALHEQNKKVEQRFADLCKLEDTCSAPVNWKIMATQSREKWSDTDATIGAVLLRIHEAFSRVRELLREMGTSAGVPIEPPEQTEILEATLAIPGVLTAGVPGDVMSKRRLHGGDEKKGLKANRTHNEAVRLERDQPKEFAILGLRFATESWAGMKTTNEDRHVTSVEHFPDELQVLEDQLTVAIAEMQREVKQIDAEEIIRRVDRQNWCNKHHNHFLKAFSEGFERVDTQLMQKNPTQDGSTALLIWFIAGEVETGTGAEDKQSAGELSFYTVNVGDCRAVVCRGGRGVPLTSDHKPDRPDERQRIEKAGGFVGKLAGISRVYSAAGAGLALQQGSSKYLAVSRAFGDRALKVPTPLVSYEPEVKRFQVEDDDLFLVLGCDGIWDVLTEQEVVDIALPHFHDAKAAADAIVKAAYQKNSADNLTATVVQFGWKSKAQIQQAVAKSTTDSLANTGEEEEEIDMFNV